MSGPAKDVRRLPRASKSGGAARALMAGLDFTPVQNMEAVLVPLEKLLPNPEQPRQTYNAEQEAELVESIRSQGILQPLIVRQADDGFYQVVAGERRFRAARELGLTDVPVIVKDLSDQQSRAVSLVENLQRADLNPKDEQLFFQRLQNEFNFSIRDIAAFIHKSEKYVRNRLEGELQVFQAAPVEEPDSDENHNEFFQPTLRFKSQNSGSGVIRPSIFTTYSRKLERVLASTELQPPPDEKTRRRLKNSLAEMENHLAELKKRLGLDE